MSNLVENVQLDESSVDQMLSMNQLQYDTPMSLDLAKSRSHNLNRADNQTNQQNDTMIFRVNVGAQYCDASKSYLRFQFNPDSTGSFGSGSAFNVINRVDVKSSNGQTISTLRQANLWKFHSDYMECPLDYFSSSGQSVGYPYAVDGINTGSSAQDQKAGYVYSIPMDAFPCFRLLGDKLIPPQLLNGATIEIQLEQPSIAVFTAIAGPAVVSYNVSDARIHWDLYELHDQFTRKIAQITEKDGLYLAWKEVHSDFETKTVSGTSDTKKITKYASRALRCLYVPRTMATTAVGEGQQDSMLTSVADYSSVQFDIGGTHFLPKNPIIVRNNTIGSIAELYFYTVQAMNKQACWSSPSVSPVDYLGKTLAGVALTRRNGILCVDLNKNKVSALEGQEIDNNLSLNFNINYFSANADRRVDYFMEYIRGLVIFPNNEVLQE